MISNTGHLSALESAMNMLEEGPVEWRAGAVSESGLGAERRELRNVILLQANEPLQQSLEISGVGFFFIIFFGLARTESSN